MHDIAIKAESLGKAYRVGNKDQKSDTFVEAAINLIKKPIRNYRRLRDLNTFAGHQGGDDILWALKDINFEIRHGEVVGFIGRNGAGKSTLLKIISRITAPTEGLVEIYGRVSSLLEVGTGFHQELTGRENVYMNATILGMKKVEVDKKFDEIIDFSGVERFLDTPVKRYSSGMKVRLAFAVAAYLEPDILIIDEVLAVGDAEFQKKCLNKMQDVAGGGRTVLFVSHNLGAIKTLCQRAISLRNGVMIEDGIPEEIISNYLDAFNKFDSSPFSADNPSRTYTGPVRINNGVLFDAKGFPTTIAVSGECVTFEVEYESLNEEHSIDIWIIVFNDNGLPIFKLSNVFLNYQIDSAIHNKVICEVPSLPLPKGKYNVQIELLANKIHSDIIPNALQFSVEASFFHENEFYQNSRSVCVFVDQKWTTEKN
jgi:lipopolysaccharide transport system ATP-binding protein